MPNRRIRVLVVGQTPPPFHGQAIMIEKLVQSRFERVELLHVRMAFSRTIDDTGAFRPSKVVHLADVIRRIVALRARYSIDVLYYPPAGPHRIPMYRDIALLLAVRPLFPRTVFHFHAGGLTDLAPRLTQAEQWLFRRAYYEPHGAIMLAEENPPDARQLHAQRRYIIPYGIEDHAGAIAATQPAVPTILYVGALTESKGVADFIAACAIMKRCGIAFRAQLMGAFSSRAFELQLRNLVASEGLASSVTFVGVRTGTAKWQTYADATAFCFPTFYESETFGVVLLEAMQFSLPVVATHWRGIPSVVVDGTTGYLVRPRDVSALADRLTTLVTQPELARRLGEQGRARYLEHFTLERWRTRMEDALVEVAT